jgi:hypothetical protein
MALASASAQSGQGGKRRRKRSCTGNYTNYRLPGKEVAPLNRDRFALLEKESALTRELRTERRLRPLTILHELNRLSIGGGRYDQN